MADEIRVGLLGLGVIGSAVAQGLTIKRESIARRVGKLVSIAAALEKDPARFQALPTELITADAGSILNDPRIDIIVELLGGEEPARTFIAQALGKGKHVVTANKEVLAKHGHALLNLAQEHGAELRFEASVGGGIPLIGPLSKDLAVNEFSSLYAIINGTTNYMLTRMAQDNLDFASALAEAQGMGYAEANPRNDVEGFDAIYKLAILASLCFRSVVRPDDVYREGISRLSPKDFRYAREMGYGIKLLAITKNTERGIEARVHPTLLPLASLLAEVDGVFNAVQVEGDLVGKVIFHGRGAGPAPTSSAVIGDIMDVASGMRAGCTTRRTIELNPRPRLLDMADVETRYYLRMQVTDAPGVLAQIAHVLGSAQISIASMIQQETDATNQSAEIVIMTHAAHEASAQQALRTLNSLPVVKEVSSAIRVEG